MEKGEPGPLPWLSLSLSLTQVTAMLTLAIGPCGPEVGAAVWTLSARPHNAEGSESPMSLTAGSEHPHPAPKADGVYLPGDKAFHL